MERENSARKMRKEIVNQKPREHLLLPGLLRSKKEEMEHKTVGLKPYPLIKALDVL